MLIDIVISIKPVLKLLVIAAGGAVLARKGPVIVNPPILTARLFEFGGFEGHVDGCN